MQLLVWPPQVVEPSEPVKIILDNYMISCKKTFLAKLSSKLAHVLNTNPTISSITIKDQFSADSESIKGFLSFFNGKPLAITPENCKYLFEIITKFGITELLTLIVPYCFLFQQLDFYKQQINSDEKYFNASEFLSVIFPIVRVTEYINLINLQDLINILESPNLFPISQETKLLSLVKYFEEDPDNKDLVDYLTTHKSYVSHEIKTLVDIYTEKLDEFMKEQVTNSIKYYNSLESYSNIEKFEIQRCWDNFVSNMSSLSFSTDGIKIEKTLNYSIYYENFLKKCEKQKLE